ncbi:MAG: HepT-like ribonuclease domain-containing protein [Bacteroidota bacterium]
MNKREKKLHYDISLAITHIFNTHLQGIANFHSLAENLTVQRAVERKIGIIGEATYQLMRLGKSLSCSDQIINRRNTIVHQYDAFKPEGIWTFVHQELPSLKVEVDKLLD